MKKMLLFLMLIVGVCLPTIAQVSLTIQSNEPTYMKYEPIYIKIDMRNYSGQPLIFGADQKLKGELLFDITAPDRSKIAFSGSRAIPIEGTILQPGETKSFVIKLTDYYNISKLGRYRIHAYVRHSMLKDLFQSKDISLDVMSGVELWRARVGIPDVLRSVEPKAGEKIMERSFVLSSLTVKNLRYYYLKIEDDKNLYAVFRVGREVGKERYSADVDMLSRLYMLMPISPRLFRFSVINVSGQVEEDRYVKSTDTIPMLVRDPKSGFIKLVGGTDAIPGVDYDVKQPDK